MKPTFSQLTKEQQETFGNGCSFVPDFMFTADCRHHDFNYARGGYLKDKVKADIDLCWRMFSDALDAPTLYQKIFYVFITYLYFFGLTLLPFSYFAFTWGRWRTVVDILHNDAVNKL